MRRPLERGADPPPGAMMQPVPPDRTDLNSNCDDGAFMPPEGPDRSSALGWGMALVGLGVIGAVVVGITGAFAFSGGWLSRERPTSQERVVAAVGLADGMHPDLPPRQSENGCGAGWFTSAGQAVELSRTASLGRVPLIGRLALGGGMAFRTDASEAMHTMSVRFPPPGEDEWRIGMDDITVIAVNPARGAADRLAAAPDPAAGKPDPAELQVFLTTHPEVVRALANGADRQASPASDNPGQSGLQLVDAAGQTILVRSSTRSVRPFEPAGPAVEAGRNTLFDAVLDPVAQPGPQLRPLMAAGTSGDPANATTRGNHRQIDSGMAAIDRAEGGETLPCPAVEHGPATLRAGIDPADDLPRSARSSVYARLLSLWPQAHDDKPHGAAEPVSASHDKGRS